MKDAILQLLVLLLIFVSVLLLVETVVSLLMRSRAENRAVNQRLTLIGRGTPRLETMSLLRRDSYAISGHLPAILHRAGRAFEAMLLMAGITTPTPQIILLLTIAPMTLLALMIIILFAISAPIGAGRILLLGTFALVIGLVVPLLIIQARGQRRRKKMQDQFPVALDVFVRGLRAGHPVAAALDLLTVEMSDPIGSQFGLVVDEVTYGADLRGALSAMAERWDLDDIRMFVVSLAVQAETGGNLAEILENLSKVIRDRASMFMKVRALSSEGRMSAVMLTALPIMTFAILFVFNPGFFLDVADDPLFMPGFVGLILLYFIGFFTIRRMVDLKV